MRPFGIVTYLRFFIKAFDVKVDMYNVKEAATSFNEEDISTLSTFYSLISKKTDITGLLFKLETLSSNEITEYLKDLPFPFIYFKKSNNLEPLLIHKTYLDRRDKFKLQVIHTDGIDEFTDSFDIAKFTPATISDMSKSGLLGTIDPADYPDDTVFIITCIEKPVMVSEKKFELDSQSKENFNGPTPMSRVYNLLKNEKLDIGLIYFYAIMMGLVSLSLPLGIQAIIGLISGGLFLNSVIVLIIIVVLATMVAGWIQVLQLIVVEKLQQRIFAKASFEFAFRIPRVKMENIANSYAPELMNRFFDTLTIQKSLPKILIDFSTAGIQIVFGLIMLALYHPLFIVFGAVVIGVIIVIFYLTSARALDYNIKSSKYKYRVAYWIEELARTLHTFKLTGEYAFPISKMDKLLNGYLVYRQNHFNVIVKQYKAIIAFKVFITAGLLVLGAFLLVDRQINLGQFVAAEIIILLVIASVEKLISTLESVYDLLTAVDKVGLVTDLDLERDNGIEFEEIVDNRRVELELRGLNYKYLGGSRNVLDNINLTIKPFEILCITGSDGSGKSTLARILAALYENYTGAFLANGMPLTEINLNSFRNKVSDNLTEQDIFEGTIEENISLKRKGMSMKKAFEAIEIVKAKKFIEKLPQGIKTNLEAGGYMLPESIKQKLIMARTIANDPYFIIVDETYLNIAKHDKINIIKHICMQKNRWTVVLITNNHELMRTADKIVLMDEGNIVAQGKYEDLQSHPVFSKI
jgi:ABC-type bacteriocin/lantibiotic exporter with double-glycine peptidase domain